MNSNNSTRSLSAFTQYMNADRLETGQLCTSTSSKCNPTHQLTAGIRSVVTPGTSATAAPLSSLSLPDGRLNVGTHLPLLHGRYKYLGTLGEGVSGQVLLAEDIFLHKTVTVKVMKRQYGYAGQREARTLRFLHSKLPSGEAPGILKLIGTFTIAGHFCLVTERLFPKFLDWMAESITLPKPEALHSLRKIAHQLLVAVSYMHRHGCVHADIKPDNILFTHPQHHRSVGLRLIDFGNVLSTTETNVEEVVLEVQTLPYRAPEAALGLSSTGKPMDLWSIGIVIAEAALKRPLFPCDTVMDLLQQMMGTFGPIPIDTIQASPMRAQFSHLVSLATTQAYSRMDAQQAYGCTLAAELAAQKGQTAFRRGVEAVAAVPEVIKELQRIDHQLSSLVHWLLEYRPEARPTAEKALLHPFFDSLLALRAILPLNGDRGFSAGALAEDIIRPQQHQQQQIANIEHRRPSTTIDNNAPPPQLATTRQIQQPLTKEQPQAPAVIQHITDGSTYDDLSPVPHKPQQQHQQALKPQPSVEAAASVISPTAKQQTKTPAAELKPGANKSDIQLLQASAKQQRTESRTEEEEDVVVADSEDEEQQPTTRTKRGRFSRGKTDWWKV